MKPIIVDVDKAIEILNEALKADSIAISQLIGNRVLANKNLCDHPTIQCGDDSVGMLGIINGIFGISVNRKGYGFISCVEEEGKIVRFERTSRTEEG